MPSAKPRRIDVTQRHIDMSMRENSGRCMTAEGMRSAIPGATRIHVDLQTLRYTDVQGVRRTCLTPPSVQAAIARYDAGDEVEPFAFNLPRPIHISHRTARTEAAKSRRKGETARLSQQPPSKVGGKAVPVVVRSTQRKFGMRRLRINQQGQVVQSGVAGTND